MYSRQRQSQQVRRCGIRYVVIRQPVTATLQEVAHRFADRLNAFWKPDRDGCGQQISLRGGRQGTQHRIPADLYFTRMQLRADGHESSHHSKHNEKDWLEITGYVYIHIQISLKRVSTKNLVRI